MDYRPPVPRGESCHRHVAHDAARRSGWLVFSSLYIHTKKYENIPSFFAMFLKVIQKFVKNVALNDIELGQIFQNFYKNLEKYFLFF